MQLYCKLVSLNPVHDFNTKGRLFKRQIFGPSGLFLSVWFYKTVHNKWCLDITIGPIGNGLERGFVKHWLNYI